MEKMTRKQFLADVVAGVEMTPAHIEVATAWIVALEKKSATPRVNKTALANEGLARDVHALALANGEPISAKWCAEHVSGITSPQKAVGVLRKGIELGLFERVEIKGRAFFKAL